jgi:hypothetical protein
MNHDERVAQVDTVRAYYFGEKLLVELDIVLHDVGESPTCIVIQYPVDSIPTCTPAGGDPCRVGDAII